MNQNITLRDIDNRGDDGAPYEFTGTVDQVIGYLDGALRGDVRDPDESGPKIDQAIVFLRAANLDEANKILNRDFAIYLHHAPAPSTGCC